MVGIGVVVEVEVVVAVGVVVVVEVVGGVVVEVVVGVRVAVAVDFTMEGSMKKIFQVQEVSGEGLEGLMGQRVTVWCLNYIYTGVLTGVNGDCILLEDAGIVYETGPLTDAKWGDMQKLPHPCYIMKRCIESFMILK